MDVGFKKLHKPNPKETAGPLSVLTFWWILGTFRAGLKKDLEIDDLYDALKAHQSGVLGDKLESLWHEELKRARVRHKTPSFLKVVVKCFGIEVLVYGLLMTVVELAFHMIQPIFLGGLIHYFTPNSGMDIGTAYLYASGVIICSLINIYGKNPIWLEAYHTGLKLRVGACSLIYRKTLRLSTTALGQTTIGQAVNLLSNDVARFDRTFLVIAFLVIGPLETLIILYLMWSKIGISALIGVATILLVIPVQAGVGKMISKLRLNTAKRTDERIRFMNEIIVGIHVIKMYAWEKPFAHLIALSRRHEIMAVRRALFTTGTLISFGRYGTKIAIFVSIISYVLIEDNITAEKIFVVAAYFNIVRITMTEIFPLAIMELAESLASIKRIQTYLLNNEVAAATIFNDIYKKSSSKHNGDQTHEMNGNGSVGSKISLGGVKPNHSDDSTVNFEDHFTNTNDIKISNATAKWTENISENTLKNINIDISPGSLVAIIGPVGSGKTSLLHVILKELPLNNGHISVGGSVSYASQDPWLFSASVQQNILFGQPMDKERYHEVLKVCALERDLRLLPHRDKTIVGDRGVNLSGGQKARINLARAVYRQANIYLLDDPLSAVDTHVGRHLFDKCICGFLRGKTRILVTHQLQYLKNADAIVMLNEGAVEATGTYTELQTSGLNFAKQLGLEIAHDENTRKESRDSLGSNLSPKHSKRQNSESSEMSLGSELEPKIFAETRTRGRVDPKIYTSYLSAGGNCFTILLLFGLFALEQLAISGGDYWMSYWSNVEEEHLKNSQEVNVSTQGYTTDSLSWLPSTNTSIYIYTGIVISIVILSVCSVMYALAFCMRASIHLHDMMFSSISRATMWFFNNNPSGQILNRFSKDMGSVDERLPTTFMECIQIAMSGLGIIIVVSIVNVWILIPTVFVFILFYLLRVCYVSTSRSIKRLEGITRSPVFSHINASLQGLTTIRALGAETMLKNEFDSLQDVHSSAAFMVIATARAFAVYLDSSCLIYIICVTLSFLIMRGEYYSGDVGLAITQAIGLTGIIQKGIRQSAELENHMTSVERMLEYTKIDSEPPLESSPGMKPNEDWPSRGTIVFDHVFLAYCKDELPVLKNVSFSFKSTEKIGVVGRTGAGKTTLISALFRLVDITEGSIKIDGVNTLTIGLHDLRSKISIIPQEPTLFSGTLRQNLDPFNQYPDSALWSALADVELKSIVEDLPAGLCHKVSEGGTNFSVGQRQLLCLARAILRDNKILVLDEATANVDPQTDELIQATIRQKFSECTVMTIAHRLHTVIDSDRIIVMDVGSVVEFDHPYVLLMNETGYLYNMVQQSGRFMSESLLKVAKENFDNRTSKKM